jgi:hypothetical protein
LDRNRRKHLHHCLAQTFGLTGTYFHGLFREDTTAGKLYFRAALAFTPAEDTIFSPEIVAVDLSLKTGQIYYQKFIRLANITQEFSVDSVAHLVVNTGYINDRRFVEIELILDSLWQVANEGSVPWVTSVIVEGDVLITTVLNQRYIEGIGSSFGLFFPVVEAYYPQHYPFDPYLHCVNTADSIIWENPHILNCQFIVLSDPDFANTAGNINVFPNPSNGIFQVTNESSAIESYSVYNPSGKELKEIRLYSSNDTFTIDLSQYERGVYHLVLRTDHGSTICKKLLITH